MAIFKFRNSGRSKFRPPPIKASICMDLKVNSALLFDNIFA